MTKHCCDEMAEHLSEGEIAITYSAQFREYGLLYGSDFGGGVQLINFCPWCGARLPSSLRDEWFDELEKRGIDDPGDNIIPPEFESDSWWKNRS